MFRTFLAGCLAAGWLSDASLAGFGFAAGSGIAAGSARRRDLLVVVVMPPALFLCAAGLLSAVVARAALTLALLAGGTFLTIRSAAP